MKAGRVGLSHLPAPLPVCPALWGGDGEAEGGNETKTLPGVRREGRGRRLGAGRGGEDELGRTEWGGQASTGRWQKLLSGDRQLPLLLNALHMGGLALSSGSLCAVSEGSSFQHALPNITAMHPKCPVSRGRDARPAVLRVLPWRAVACRCRLHLSS